MDKDRLFMNKEVADMPTIFYAIHIWPEENWKEKWEELTEHLDMNGYTYGTSGKNTLYVYDEEFEYVRTIVEDRKLVYEVL